MWRKVPIDVVALVLIVAAMLATHLPLLDRGIAFNDSSWYFHFGRRALAGDVPYRDYVFQVGPLPIYVDAGFQSIFGSRYLASAYAALSMTTLRVFVVWLIARRLAGWRAGALLAAFCGLDQAFAVAHHWSWQYAQLFISLGGLFLLLASRATGRAAFVHLFLGGLAAALVVSGRQATFVMVGLMMLTATSIFLVRRHHFTWKRFAAYWAGFAAGLVIVFGMLALAGALGPAIHQMFLDAAQKKGIHGISAVLDAVFGGALIDRSTWWKGLLYWVTLPALLVAGIVYLASRDRELSSGMLAMFVLPAAMMVGLLARDAAMDFISDLPRTILTATTAIAILAPGRMRRWLGIEPVVAVGLGALPLASTWAVEMSVPGRGWSDVAAMLAGVVLLVLASPRLRERTKLVICAAFAVNGAAHAVLWVRGDLHPFAMYETADGTLTDSRFEVDTPILSGLRVSESRKRATEWLLARVDPGSTCFIYGTVPILYDILRCTNPTRIDVTIPDFIAVSDAEQAIAALRAAPPTTSSPRRTAG